MFTAQEVPANEEWRRLKTLRSHRQRLLNTTRFQPLNRSQLFLGGVSPQNDASLLEDGLRNMMERNDLDTLLDNGLDAEAQEQAFASLTSLCTVLENIVDTSLWTEALSESRSSYPKIDRLLQELGSTEWQFSMASGSHGRKLFVTTNLKLVKEQVNSFNTLFNRLTQTDIRDIYVPNPQQEREQQTWGSHNPLQKAIQSLKALLDWLAKHTTTTCGRCHNALLQLPEWDVTASREPFQRHLDMYISSCSRPLVWRESRLHELADPSVRHWFPAKSLCDEIEGLLTCERLTLAAAESDIYIYDRPNDDPESPILSRRPSKTLEKLIQDGAFLGPDARWSKWRKFERIEKRILAATLVLGCSLNIGDVHLVNCWDSQFVYLPTDSEGKYIDNIPSARLTSVSNEPIELEAIFAHLARLLMEIDCGISLKNKQIKKSDHPQTTGNPDHSIDTFEDFIIEQSSVDLGYARRLYLQAVDMCFKFRQETKKEYRRMGNQGGLEAARRNVIHKIVQKIQNAVSHDQGICIPVAESFHWPPIQSRSEELGMSMGYPPTDIVPNVPDKVAVHRWLKNTEKRVRFTEKGSQTEKEKSEVLMDYLTATTDACELFGDTDTQEHSKELRKCSRKWINEFKALRMNKTGGSSERRIKVAVLDTVVDINHPDIKGNFCDYKTFIDSDATIDQSGHGTHVAGVILDLTTNVDLYIGQVIECRRSKDRRPIIEALIHAREIWQVDMISLSFGFRNSDDPDMVRRQVDACRKAGIIVFASASNDAGNKPRTFPGDYYEVFCIYSATGEGNSSSFNPSPVLQEKNFSFVGDPVKSYWPMNRDDFDDQQGRKYLSGTSIATPVAVSVAIFMMNYIRKNLPECHWNIEPLSPEGIRKIFALMAHNREGYDWVSPLHFFTGGQNGEELVKARLKETLGAYIPKPA